MLCFIDFLFLCDCCKMLRWFCVKPRNKIYLRINFWRSTFSFTKWLMKLSHLILAWFLGPILGWPWATLLQLIKLPPKMLNDNEIMTDKTHLTFHYQWSKHCVGLFDHKSCFVSFVGGVWLLSRLCLQGSSNKEARDCCLGVAKMRPLGRRAESGEAGQSGERLATSQPAQAASCQHEAVQCSTLQQHNMLYKIDIDW